MQIHKIEFEAFVYIYIYIYKELLHRRNVHQKDNQAVKSVFLVNLLNLGGWMKVHTTEAREI